MIRYALRDRKTGLLWCGSQQHREGGIFYLTHSKARQVMKNRNSYASDGDYEIVRYSLKELKSEKYT